MSVLAALEEAGLTARLSPTFVEPQVLVSPRAALTPALRAIIVSHREALLDELYGRWCDDLWPPIAQDALAAIAARWAALNATGQAGNDGMFVGSGSGDGL